MLDNVKKSNKNHVNRKKKCKKIWFDKHNDAHIFLYSPRRLYRRVMQYKKSVHPYNHDVVSLEKKNHNNNTSINECKRSRVVLSRDFYNGFVQRKRPLARTTCHGNGVTNVVSVRRFLSNEK